MTNETNRLDIMEKIRVIMEQKRIAKEQKEKQLSKAEAHKLRRETNVLMFDVINVLIFDILPHSLGGAEVI